MVKKIRFRRILMLLLAILFSVGVFFTKNRYLIPFIICCLVLAFCKDQDLYGSKRK